MALTENGTDFSAIWKGTGVLPPPDREWQHWISLSASSLPQNPRSLAGVLSVYLCTEGGNQFHNVTVVHDPNARLPRDTDGQPLFGTRFDCLPEIDVVFQYGSDVVQAWLQANDWQPTWGYNDNFPDPEPVKQYSKTYEAEHPFFHDEEFVAMLGGWSMPFPDSDWGELVDKTLLVLTIRDSEPWLEIYDDGETFRCFSRIT